MVHRNVPIVVLAFTVSICGTALGQTPTAECPLHNQKTAGDSSAKSPYVGLETRQIKALSAEQRQQLLAGHGMRLALAAELNHYPGPKHVLELASALDLSDEQQQATRTIFHEMQQLAQALGRKIVDAEATLDAAFASNTIDEDSLVEAVRNIGRLQADLRVAHLNAHLLMRAALTADQIRLYDDHRGYDRRAARH